ncbi:hypothetical protein F4821DRAFT_265424 [Hypoxylon rubiginosum]|uniref:Uncharacterized protein n=1 Tax=Hypoxylon rubiginosum TaxID=110542 RepID=A0ACC0CKF3_9PEZI|nr:hypothetical protein F4821DRAFT_265424 [Hypoxylon rubiginosum]
MDSMGLLMEDRGPPLDLLLPRYLSKGYSAESAPRRLLFMALELRPVPTASDRTSAERDEFATFYFVYEYIDADVFTALDKNDKVIAFRASYRQHIRLARLGPQADSQDEELLVVCAIFEDLDATELVASLASSYPIVVTITDKLKLTDHFAVLDHHNRTIAQILKRFTFPALHPISAPDKTNGLHHNNWVFGIGWSLGVAGPRGAEFYPRALAATNHRRNNGLWKVFVRISRPHEEVDERRDTGTQQRGEVFPTLRVPAESRDAGERRVVSIVDPLRDPEAEESLAHAGPQVGEQQQETSEQGATSKTREEAKQVVNGDPILSKSLVMRFGQENQTDDFDWNDLYGEGSDVLHMSSPARLFVSSDSIVNMHIQFELAEYGIDYVRGRGGQRTHPKESQGGSSFDEAY